MDTFLGAVLFYVVKFGIIVAVAVAGVLVGASLRKKKDAKNQLQISQSSNQED